MARELPAVALLLAMMLLAVTLLRAGSAQLLLLELRLIALFLVWSRCFLWRHAQSIHARGGYRGALDRATPVRP
jgi:hypothetical protein